MRISTLLPVLLFLIAGFAISSCQSELEYEATTPASGSLKDSSGNCLPSSVSGVFQEDSILNNTHFINAGVYFSNAGSYDIRTDTVNGIYFKGNGYTASPGIRTIKLNGYGQPIDTGDFVFQIRFDTSVCTITVNIDDNIPDPAIFILSGNGASCTGATLNGTYTAGSAMNASNTVTLNVSIISPGSYSITTPTVNGVYFTGAGLLSPSSTTVVLTAVGTATASTTNIISTYNVPGSSSSCSFNVTFAGVPVGPSSFTFNCSTLGPTFPVSGERLRVGQVLNPLVDTITVEVNVISTGSYTINTTYGLGGSDGVNFNTSGVFTNTGVQTIRLGASGTAGRGGLVFYNLSSPQATNPNPCSLTTYYEFLYCATNGGFNRNFTFLSDVVNDNSSISGYDLIRLKGFSAGSNPESVEITIGLPTGGNFDVIGTGNDITYTSNDFPGKYVKAVYRDNSNPAVIFSAETNGTVQANPFSVTITFCTAGRIEGNYTGVVKDNGGAGPGTRTISGNFGLWRL